MTDPKPITAEDLERLAKVCGMFGSEHAGERAAAALKADQLIKAMGLTWAQVLRQQPVEKPVDEKIQRRTATWNAFKDAMDRGAYSRAPTSEELIDILRREYGYGQPRGPRR